MIDLGKLPHLNLKDIVYRFEPNIEGGTLFIYNIDSKRVVTSNEVGYEILECIREGFTCAETIEALSKKFSINHQQMEEDVLNFVSQLIEEGVITL